MDTDGTGAGATTKPAFARKSRAPDVPRPLSAAMKPCRATCKHRGVRSRGRHETLRWVHGRPCHRLNEDRRGCVGATHVAGNVFVVFHSFLDCHHDPELVGPKVSQHGHVELPHSGRNASDSPPLQQISLSFLCQTSFEALSGAATQGRTPTRTRLLGRRNPLACRRFPAIARAAGRLGHKEADAARSRGAASSA